MQRAQPRQVARRVGTLAVSSAHEIGAEPPRSSARSFASAKPSAMNERMTDENPSYLPAGAARAGGLRLVAIVGLAARAARGGEWGSLGRTSTSRGRPSARRAGCTGSCR